jgi:hypothetical protein
MCGFADYRVVANADVQVFDVRIAQGNTIVAFHQLILCHTRNSLSLIYFGKEKTLPI